MDHQKSGVSKFQQGTSEFSSSEIRKMQLAIYKMGLLVRKSGLFDLLHTHCCPTKKQCQPLTDQRSGLLAWCAAL